jgi:hypothetical protein
MDSKTDLEQETGQFIRELSKMEEINGNPWRKDPQLDQVIKIARRNGVGSMEYALRDFMELSNHTTLTEVKNEAGEVVAYQPQIALEVDWFNADTVIRQLFSCQIIFYALRYNEEFKVKYGSSKDVNIDGPAHIKSKEGYATFTRTGTQEQMMELAYVYASKALEVKEWQVGIAKGVLSLTEDLKGKGKEK